MHNQGLDTIAVTHISLAIKYQTPIIWFALPEKDTDKGIYHFSMTAKNLSVIVHFHAALFDDALEMVLDLFVFFSYFCKDLENA